MKLNNEDFEEMIAELKTLSIVKKVNAILGENNEKGIRVYLQFLYMSGADLNLFSKIITKYEDKNGYAVSIFYDNRFNLYEII